MDINLQCFLDRINRGEMAYGCCVTLSDCAVTEVACAAGMDFVWNYGARDVREYLEESRRSPLVILQFEHIDAHRGVKYMGVKNDTGALLEGLRMARRKAEEGR